MGLHAREKSQATRLPGSDEPRFQAEKRVSWQDLQRIALATSRLSPSGYWPNGMDEGAKAASVAAFEREIYPLWKGIEERDKIAEDKMTPAEVTSQRVLLECVTLHKQDLAVYQSGIKPNRSGGDQERMADLRRKAARAAGV
jgi:hypothetical protein